MVIQTLSYNDFKTMVSHLTTPTVYASYAGSAWETVALSAATAVTFNTYDGPPEAFATDFPFAVPLENFIYPS